MASPAPQCPVKKASVLPGGRNVLETPVLNLDVQGFLLRVKTPTESNDLNRQIIHVIRKTSPLRHRIEAIYVTEVRDPSWVTMKNSDYPEAIIRVKATHMCN